MTRDDREVLVSKPVTYTLEVDGQFIIIHNVPARVNEETGEQFFSPETVERLHRLIFETGKPERTIETPIYNYVT